MIDRYLAAGAALASAGSLLAIFLNLQGAACLANLARVGGSGLTEPLPPGFADLERDCFIITNSYVYSLFAAAAGGAILLYWFKKRRQQR